MVNFGKKHSRKIEKILNIAESLKNKGINFNEPLKREHLFKKLNKARIFFIQRNT